MNIYAKNGDKVRFLNRNGRDMERAEAAKILKEGGVYTVERTSVGQSCSSVYLQEIPGRGFNTVMFEGVDVAKRADKQMEIRIKNQLKGTVDFCLGQHEYQLEPEQDAIVPVSDGDCMYLDQLVQEKKQNPAVEALSEILQAMNNYKEGKITREVTLTLIKLSVMKYLETVDPIPYDLTDKAGGLDD